MATAREETRAEARARLDRTFIEQLVDLANAMHDHPDDVVSWVGDQVGKLADRARFLGARNPEEFEDREMTAMDAYNDARESAAYRDTM